MPSIRTQISGMRFIVALALFVGAAALYPNVVMAQLTSTTAQTDVSQLLQQFGPLLGLSGTGTGITTTTDTGTTTTQPSTPTTPPTGDGTGPQPTVVSNQFTTTTSGALNGRRPGLMIQRSIAIQNGTATIPGNESDDSSWFERTSNDIALTILDTFSGILDTVGAALGFTDFLNPGGGGGGGGQSTIPNAATSGGGTTTPIQ